MRFAAKTFDELTTAELYEKCGFHVTSDEFLEEGIVHVGMEYRGGSND